jgi:pyruvate dehydrogenase E1 component alpha subunit
VTVVFFGEAATEEGIFHEAMNFAALKSLPVVFACENNLYSVYSPMGVRQPEGREVVRVAAAHGIEGIQGDGNDVLEVHRIAGAAVQKARDGGGPTFLEFKTYRWLEHCGASWDNHLGYRTEAEFQEWRKLCPIERFERGWIEEGLLTEAERRRVREEIDAEIEDAVRFAKTSPFPEASALLDHVYASRGREGS